MREKILERADPPWPADDLRVQADRHHARRSRAFSIESIECVAAISFEVTAGKHGAPPEAEVVYVHRVRNHEEWPAPDILEVRDVVIDRGGIIEKPFLCED